MTDINCDECTHGNKSTSTDDFFKDVIFCSKHSYVVRGCIMHCANFMKKTESAENVSEVVHETNKKLALELKELKAESRKIKTSSDVVHESNQRLLKENDELKTELKKEKAISKVAHESNQRLLKRNDDLKEGNDELEFRISCLDSEIERLQTEKKQAEDKLKELNKSNLRLILEKNHLKQEKDGLESRVNHLSINNKDPAMFKFLKDEFKRIKRENTELEGRLSYYDIIFNQGETHGRKC